MLKDLHHVSMYGLDLAGVQLSMQKYFGIVPVKLEGFDESEAEDGAPRPAAALLTPKVAMFPIGPSLLEFMQPRARLGRLYDVIRRNGGVPTVSHVCWRLVDISARFEELRRNGADVLEKGFAGMSPHGGYRTLNLFAEEAVRGVWFQLAEDLTHDEMEAIEKGDLNVKSHVKDVEATGHRWRTKTERVGLLTHVHHTCYQLWGLDYMVDYMEKVFEVTPFKRVELPDQGIRGALFRFGRTIAQFEEPTKFGQPSADFALRFGTHSGFCGGGVSHLGWGVENLDSAVLELRKAGMKFVQKEAAVSPYGGYRRIDTQPELSGGLSLQLCEDV